MKKSLIVGFSLLVMVGGAAAQPAIMDPGSTPGDLFYSFDRFSESLELTVASLPVVGSSELEAKVRANHAEERLAEARKLIEKNRTQEAEDLMEQYSEGLNKSMDAAEKANSTELSSKLDNVTRKQVEVLQRVEKNAPEQAKKGLRNAIENSLNRANKAAKGPRKDVGRPENPGKPAEKIENLTEKIREKSEKAAGKLENKSERLANRTGKAVETAKNISGQPVNKSESIVPENANKTEKLLNRTKKTVEGMENKTSETENLSKEAEEVKKKAEKLTNELKQLTESSKTSKQEDSGSSTGSELGLP